MSESLEHAEGEPISDERLVEILRDGTLDDAETIATFDRWYGERQQELDAVYESQGSRALAEEQLRLEHEQAMRRIAEKLYAAEA